MRPEREPLIGRLLWYVIVTMVAGVLGAAVWRTAGRLERAAVREFRNLIEQAFP